MFIACPLVDLQSQFPSTPTHIIHRCESGSFLARRTPLANMQAITQDGRKKMHPEHKRNTIRCKNIQLPSRHHQPAHTCMPSNSRPPTIADRHKLPRLYHGLYLA